MGNAHHITGPQLPSAMADEGTTIEALLALAIGHVNAGQRERARALCAHALVAFAPHAAVHQLLALLSLQQGDVALSRQHAATSLALRPDHLPTLAVAADAARAAGDLAAALHTLERVVALAPGHTEAWFQLALVRQDVHDLAGAAQALHEVLRLDPERADAQVNLGIVLQESGHLDEAMRAYGRAYRLRDETFGRIAHALATPKLGRLWLNLDDLRNTLRESAV
jgi:tetratricopeptide (TPR) repeat protein